jgi:hypothetical protein
LNLEKRVQPNDIKITVAKKDTDRIIHGWAPLILQVNTYNFNALNEIVADAFNVG